MTNNFNSTQKQHLHDFFQGVSRKAAAELNKRNVDEDVITDFICRFMDENDSYSSSLEMPINTLKQRLNDGQGGLELSIQIHRHTSRFENQVSGADAGLVLIVRQAGHLLLNKALLLQAKKLYPTNGTYLIRSKYEAFKETQHHVLTKLGGECYTQYLLYNPELERFEKHDQSKIRTNEKKLGRSVESHCHQYPSIDFENRCPGLRVINACSISRQNGKPSLEDCYASCGGASNVQLRTFADFMVYGVLDGQLGANESHLVELASGKNPKHEASPPFTLTVEIDRADGWPKVSSDR